MTDNPQELISNKEIIIIMLRAISTGIFTLIGVIAAYFFAIRTEQKKVKRTKIESILLKINNLIFSIAQSSSNNRLFAKRKSDEDGIAFLKKISTEFDLSNELVADIDVLLELYFPNLADKYSILNDSLNDALRSYKGYRDDKNIPSNEHTIEHNACVDLIHQLRVDLKAALVNL